MFLTGRAPNVTRKLSQGKASAIKSVLSLQSYLKDSGPDDIPVSFTNVLLEHNMVKTVARFIEDNIRSF